MVNTEPRQYRYWVCFTSRLTELVDGKVEVTETKDDVIGITRRVPICTFEHVHDLSSYIAGVVGSVRKDLGPGKDLHITIRTWNKLEDLEPPQAGPRILLPGNVRTQ